MRMSKNIDRMNALIRITFGFTVVAWSIAKLSRKPWRKSYLMMAVLGGMKIGEGMLRFSPMSALFCNGSDWEDDEFYSNYLEDVYGEGDMG